MALATISTVQHSGVRDADDVQHGPRRHDNAVVAELAVLHKILQHTAAVARRAVLRLHGRGVTCKQRRCTRTCTRSCMPSSSSTNGARENTSRSVFKPIWMTWAHAKPHTHV
jgi:hypothetical protein